MIWSQSEAPEGGEIESVKAAPHSALAEFKGPQMRGCGEGSPPLMFSISWRVSSFAKPNSWDDRADGHASVVGEALVRRVDARHQEQALHDVSHGIVVLVVHRDRGAVVREVHEEGCCFPSS